MGKQPHRTKAWIHQSTQLRSGKFLNLSRVHSGNKKIKLNLLEGVRFKSRTNLLSNECHLCMEISVSGDDGTPSSKTIPKSVVVCACKLFDEMPQSTMEALNLVVKRTQIDL